MSSQKDKDYHILRNPEKYGMDLHTYDVTETYKLVKRVPTKEYAEQKEKYDKLHQKYGKKSMVADKRRRCSTRNSNARMSKVSRRILRAQGKEEVILLTKEL